MSRNPTEPTLLLEQAFKAYFEATFGADTDFTGVAWRLSQDDSQRPLPCVLFTCEGLASRIRPGSGRWGGTITVSTWTADNVAKTAQAAHDKRVLKLGNYLDYPADIKAAVNAPATGADSRTIKPFKLYDILSVTPRRETTDDDFGHHFDVEVVISQFDV